MTTNAFISSFSTKYISIITQFIGSLVTARLIAPDSFGAFSVCIIILTTANIIRDLGISNFLIVNDSNCRKTLDSAFTLVFLTSLALFLSIMFGAGSVARFFESAAIEPALQIMSLSLLITPTYVVKSSIFKKEMDFTKDLVSSTLGIILSTSLTIYLAAQGYEVMALAIGNLALFIIQTAVILIYDRRIYSFSLLHAHSIFRKSKHVLTYNVISHLGLSCVEFISAKSAGLTDTGLLSRANTTASMFVKLFNEGFHPVVVPYFSKAKVAENKTEKFLLMAKISSNLSIPFYITLGILAEPAIVILFGQKWIAAAPFLSIICIGRALSSVTSVYEPALMGLGLANKLVKVGLYIQVFRIAIALLTFNYGIYVMVICATVFPPILRTTLFVALANRELNIDVARQLSIAAKAFLVAVLASSPLIALIVSQDSGWWSNILVLIGALVTSLCLYIALVLNYEEPKALVRSFFKNNGS